MKYVLIFIAIISIVGCQSTKNSRGVAQTTPDVQVRILPIDSTLAFGNNVTFYPGSNSSPIVAMGNRVTPVSSSLYCRFTLSGPTPNRNQSRRIQAGQKYIVQSASAAPNYTINPDGSLTINRLIPIPVTYTLKNPSTGSLFTMVCDAIASTATAPTQIAGTATDFSNYPNLTISYGQGSSVLNLSAEGQILPIRYDQPMNQQENGVEI